MLSRVVCGPCGVREPAHGGNSGNGSCEISFPPQGWEPGDGAGSHKRTPHMYGLEKSDNPIVLVIRPNLPGLRLGGRGGKGVTGGAHANT